MEKIKNISEQSGWHTEKPTKDCYVLLLTREFPKNCYYVVAEWDNDAQCFYFESNDKPIEIWDYWKEIYEYKQPFSYKYNDELELRKKIEKETENEKK